MTETNGADSVDRPQSKNKAEEILGVGSPDSAESKGSRYSTGKNGRIARLLFPNLQLMRE